jgi:hypothetical protein
MNVFSCFSHLACLDLLPGALMHFSCILLLLFVVELVTWVFCVSSLVYTCCSAGTCSRRAVISCHGIVLVVVMWRWSQDRSLLSAMCVVCVACVLMWISFDVASLLSALVGAFCVQLHLYHPLCVGSWDDPVPRVWHFSCRRSSASVQTVARQCLLHLPLFEL